MQDKVFNFQSVSFRYPNGFAALRGLDLSANSGERLCLLGASGCGKSTLLRLLAGLEQPTDGSLAINKPAAENIGIVFQQPTLMPWARVIDNVAMPLRLGGASKQAARETAREKLAMVDLADAQDHYPAQLSGGMAMRVAIARALVGEPQLLLMDEPFAALDEMTRFRLNDLLLTLHEARAFTLVFVTHSVFESVYLGERVAIMTGPPGAIAANFVIERPDALSPQWRFLPDYQTQCADVSSRLRRVMSGPIEETAPS